MRLWNGMLVCACVIATGALAAQAGKEAIISDASSAGWSFDGNPKMTEVAAEGLPGNKAVLVTIAKKGANPWDIQARLPMKEGIAAGDTVTFGFYARAERPDPGKATATVPVRVQRNTAPYDAAVEGAVEIGKDWTFHCLAGPSKLTLGAGEVAVSLQLAGEKHAIAFGPYLATKIPGGSGKSGLPCGETIPG